jgi:hypothetical protein
MLHPFLPQTGFAGTGKRYAHRRSERRSSLFREVFRSLTLVMFLKYIYLLNTTSKALALMGAAVTVLDA